MGTAAHVALRQSRARRVDRVEPEPRPAVVDEGVEYEVVWYPHRDAAPLLSEHRPTVDSTVACRIVALRSYVPVRRGE